MIVRWDTVAQKYTFWAKYSPFFQLTSHIFGFLSQIFGLKEMGVDAKIKQKGTGNLPKERGYRAQR